MRWSRRRHPKYSQPKSKNSTPSWKTSLNTNDNLPSETSKAWLPQLLAWCLSRALLISRSANLQDVSWKRWHLSSCATWKHSTFWRTNAFGSGLNSTRNGPRSLKSTLKVNSRVDSTLYLNWSRKENSRKVFLKSVFLWNLKTNSVWFVRPIRSLFSLEIPRRLTWPKSEPISKIWASSMQKSISNCEKNSLICFSKTLRAVLTPLSQLRF